ncbi:MAG TPA: helix-turn-helix domain-containing protein [Leptolyngbyaceae cyanobacterium M33_DOE_097]|nr:helix-turn-helix domain-containing protein [Leptolyngbyaceae cyanobacterium M33_DOE_097]
MQAIPFVRSSAVLPFVTLLNQVGAPTEQLLQKANLPPCILDDPENLVPLNQGFSFAELAARAEGIDNIGILVGQQTNLSHLGNFGTVVSQSLTLHDLIRKIVQFHNTFVTGEKIWFTKENDYVWLHHQYTVPQHIETYQAQCFSVMVYLNVIYLSGDLHWQPDYLDLRSNKSKVFLELIGLSQAQTKFNQPSNAFRFPKALLSQPIIHLSNASSNPTSMEESFKSTAPATQFKDSLYQLIQILLPQGDPSLRFAAEAAGISVRTFQRRLENNNLNYSQLVEQVRFDQAVKLLQDPTNQLIDVAFDLGYSDAANFTRAFKRWTGISPREFRRLHLQK